MVKVTWEDLASFVQMLGYAVDDAPSCGQILALQACKLGAGAGSDFLMLEAQPNTPDIYNDALIWFGRDADGKKVVRGYLGTTDPGRYYTKDDPHPNGAAHLTFGQHLYHLGDHHGHEALRSYNEENRVWRDADGDFMLDVNEQVYVGTFGTNVHAGGSTEYVGKWSAGCLNIAGGWEGPWVSFIAFAKAHLAKKPTVRVNIWSTGDLVRWVETNHPATFLPTVIPGVFGLWAGKVQAALKKHGVAVTVDDDWRGGTTALVAKFQVSKGLGGDGVVGPKTWSYLLAT